MRTAGFRLGPLLFFFFTSINFSSALSKSSQVISRPVAVDLEIIEQKLWAYCSAILRNLGSPDGFQEELLSRQGLSAALLSWSLRLGVQMPWDLHGIIQSMQNSMQRDDCRFLPSSCSHWRVNPRSVLQPEALTTAWVGGPAVDHAGPVDHLRHLANELAVLEDIDRPRT